MADQWLTYAKAATALSMSVEGVRQRARREQWRRQIGNDGKALILVPSDAARPPAGEAPGNPPAERPATTRQPPERNREVEVLQARVSELKADLDRERTERLQERDRADLLSGELADQGKRLVALVEEMRELAALRERLAASELLSKEVQFRLEGDAGRARDELASYKARSWWQRLVG